MPASQRSSSVRSTEELGCSAREVASSRSRTLSGAFDRGFSGDRTLRRLSIPVWKASCVGMCYCHRQQAISTDEVTTGFGLGGVQ